MPRNNQTSTPDKPVSKGQRRFGSSTAAGDVTGNRKRRPSRRKGGTGSQRNADHHLLFGLHTVRSALANPKRTKHHLYVTANAATRLNVSEDMSLAVTQVQPRELDRMVGREAVHQGAVLQCDPLPPLSLEDLVPGGIVLVLDQISDPHNVGAIMRSASALGARAVIIPHRNSAAQTAVLAKSASGALDLLHCIEVSNLSRAISTLNSMGYQTIGLDSEGDLALEDALEDKPIALVLGAEGKGLREKTRVTCTCLARLDMPGPIKSLNVSNAAAIALYAINRSVSLTIRGTGEYPDQLIGGYVICGVPDVFLVRSPTTMIFGELEDVPSRIVQS